MISVGFDQMVPVQHAGAIPCECWSAQKPSLHNGFH